MGGWRLRDAVRLGEHRVGGAQPGEWVIFGLGSCIGLILCDPERRISAIAHIVLPAAPQGDAGGEPGKYVDTAIPFLMDELVALGARRQAVYAQMSGGARMLQLSAIADIGARNVEATRELLNALEIPLVAEIVGGTRGRTLWWDRAKGEAVVRQVGSDDLVLTPRRYVYGEAAIGGTHFNR